MSHDPQRLLGVPILLSENREIRLRGDPILLSGARELKLRGEPVLLAEARARQLQSARLHAASPVLLLADHRRKAAREAFRIALKEAAALRK